MVTFNVSFAGNATPTHQQQADIQSAAQAWATTLKNDVVINVEFWAVDMSGTGSGLNAMCIPGIVQLGTQTLTRPQAKLGGVLPPDAAGLDLVVAFDTSTAWLYGPQKHIGPKQFSLGTTMLHELCHGLGFLGLCNIDAAAEIGIYSDVSLIEKMKGVTAAMIPQPAIPDYFFPPGLEGEVLTPFAALFKYSDQQLTKGLPTDDFTAFTTAPTSITVRPSSSVYTVTTGLPFLSFTTCEHIQNPTGGRYLMSLSTVGLYLAAPDAPACEVMKAIGWTL